MAGIQSVYDILKKLRYILTKDEKRIGVVVMVLTVLEAGTELLGVSVLVPLIQAFVDADKIISSDIAQDVIRLLHIQDERMFILLLFAAVGAVFLLKNLLAIVAIYISARFSCKVIRGLGTRMMKAYMDRDYSFFVNTNVSELYRGINTDTVRVYELLNSGIQLVKSFMIIFVLLLFLICTSWQMTVGIILSAALVFALIMRGFRKVVKENGEKNREYSAIAVKNVLEAFAGIKEILVLNRQQYFVDVYKKSYAGVQKTQIKKTMAESSPIYILEAVLVCAVMVIMSFTYMSVNDLTSIVPTLAIFAYACIRILPLLGKVAGLTNVITFQSISLDAVYNEFKKMESLGKNKLSQMTGTDGTIAFQSKIEFQNVYWTYNTEENYVLKDLSLTIGKGEAIAFIGKSGAGKSTLVDIILGLFVPQRGNVLIDGKDASIYRQKWSQLVGYVPQTNYLLDDSIRHNIAFGIEEADIDEEKVWQAVRKAQMEEYIDTLPDGIETVVGERGVRLSGGQRQRIVIARALYNNPAILILDEATSALDGETEAAVVSALESLKGELTLVVVAHRLSTIKGCDSIYEIVDGHAVERDKKELF